MDTKSIKASKMSEVYESVLDEKQKKKFWGQVKKSKGCWEWLGCKTKTGYGLFYLEGCKCVHRISYGIFVGKIPKKMTIDHLCENKGCLNPKHLEAVTLRENILRSDCPAALNARKTECIKGHEDFKLRKNGKRVCMECSRIRDRKRSPRLKS